MLYALITALISFLGVGLVVSRLGLAPSAAGVFALFSAVVIAGFVLRERSLLLRLSKLEAQIMDAQSGRHLRTEHWYERSGVALLKYDASTLNVIRMSAGFRSLIGIDSGRAVIGARLEHLLQVEAARLEVVTEQIRGGTFYEDVPLVCKRVDGRVLECRVSGSYIPAEHAMEVVFVDTSAGSIRHLDLQETMDDLERFRKGMMRREKRILDLKAEVNQLLIESEQLPRYEIDANTADGKVRAMSTHRKEGA